MQKPVTPTADAPVTFAHFAIVQISWIAFGKSSSSMR